MQIHISDASPASQTSGPWNLVATITSISNNCSAESEIDLSAYSGLRYIRFLDNRAGGTHERAIDDVVVSIISGCTPPTEQANTFVASNIQQMQMDVSWSGGNGASTLVVARQGGAVNADPVNGTEYTANAAFGSGDQIGTGNYVVYKGSGSSQTVTALTANTTYHYAIYEFDGSGGSECYRVSDELTGSATTLPIPPAITHTGTTPAAADISQGATNTILYQVEVEVSDGPATLTQLVTATGGTFDSDDLDNFKLWFSTDASFNSASDVLLVTISDPTTGDQTFTVSNQVFPVGTRYLFITGDVDAAATIGHTVSCAPDADGDFTYTEDETNSGSSFAAANAMTIVGVPELQLEYPVSTNLSCGGTIPFGDLAITDHADLTFRIRNTGTADLTFSALNIAGSNPDQFSVQTQPVSPVAPGNFSDAVIRFSPTSIGAKTASITISNNDPDESSCLVNLTGTGRPVNDNCSGAITLTVESGETCNSPLSTSSSGASESIAAIECNALTGNADDDIWFKFEATGTSHIITVDGASNMDAVIDLRSGACNGSTIDCADDTDNGGVEVISATGLSIGETYYIRIYDWDAGSGDFTICVTTPVPPLHYRTVQSGDFSNASTWETSPNNNDPWSAALQGPDEDELSITIMSGDDVTISAGATLDQLTIASGSMLNVTGGTLVIADGTGNDLLVQGILKNSTNSSFTLNSGATIVVDNGGKYQHNPPSGVGTFTAMTWNSGSTCEVLAATGTSGPGGLDQSYHHFIWNASNMTSTMNLTGSLTTVLGDLSVQNTGSGALRLVGSTPSTLNIGGNVVLSSSTVLDFGNGSGTSTVNIDGDLTINSNSTLKLMGSGSQNGFLNLKGWLTNSGTITESTSGTGCTIKFNGTQSQSGSFGTITGQINIAIDNSSGLSLLSDLALDVNTTLTLTDGLLRTNGYTLTAPSTISGIGPTNFICTCDDMGSMPVTSGGLKRVVSSGTVFFPIGPISSKYMPASLIASGPHNSDNFTLRVENLGTGGVNPVNEDQCIQYQWIIDEATAGGSSLLLKFQWASGTEGANFDPLASPVIGRWNGSTFNPIVDATYNGSDPSFTSTAPFTEFSPFVLGSANSPLPVELTQFDAVLDGEVVQLTWATASEINNDYFLVQHSTDGARFDDLGMVPGAGTTGQPQAYQWMHDRPAAGVNYYRLKQVDFDGQYEYSPIRVVDLREETRGPQWSIRPTVTSDMLYLIRQGEDTGTAVWTVMTPAGRTAFSGTIAEGAENTPITVQSLPSGMYILRVSSREGVWSGRFWKE